MLEIFVTEEFERRFKELPKNVQRKAEKKENIFRQNPFHNSLHTEKLEPRSKEAWSFHIDREYRILFRFIASKKILFLTCGHHNWIYRYRF